MDATDPHHSDRLIAVGQLAAGVAHEINNPAAVVLANLGLLDESVPKIKACCERLRGYALEKGDHALVTLLAEIGLDGFIREFSETIRDSTEGMQRIVRIVKDLRTFSRSEHEEIEPVDLNDIIEAACNIVANEIGQRARLVKDLAPIPQIAGDRGKLEQAVVNLLINAAHAIETSNADENEIRIETHYEAGRISLSVLDTGLGIAAEYLGHIFEPFFTPTGLKKGNGLGLSLTAEIVQRHGGTITVQSEVGKGARFEISLPEQTPLELRQHPSSAPPPVDAPTKKHARILVIDDDEMLRKVFKRLLSDHDVVIAEGGVQGLAILRADQTFDIVLCDIMMPDLDGCQVYDTICAEHPVLAERFLFLSGGVFTKRTKEFLGRVSALVLEKPIGNEVLRGIIERLFARTSAN